MTTPKFDWKTWFVVGFCGISLGEAGYRGTLLSNATELPPEWEREEKRIPYQLAALQDRQPLISGAYTLDFYRALYPTTGAASGDIALKAYLPEEGQLEVWAYTPPLIRQLHGTWVDECQLDARNPRCRGMKQFGVGVVLDRIDEGKVQVVRSGRKQYTELSCSEELSMPKGNPIQLQVKASKQATTVVLNGQTTQCQGGGNGLNQTLPTLRPGLREVQVADIKLNGSPVPESPHIPRALVWVLGGLGALGLAFVERWNGASKRFVLLSSIPFLLSLVLVQVNAKAMMEALRASWFPYAWLALLVPLLLGGGLKLAGATIRLSKREEWASGVIAFGLLSGILCSALVVWAGMGRGAIGLLPLHVFIIVVLRRVGLPIAAASLTVFWGLIGALTVWYTAPTHWSAVFWGMILLQSSCAILLINANPRSVRWFNWLSLALSIVVLIAFETMLRGTVAGQQWSNMGSTTKQNDMFGWARQANDDFQAFEEGHHTKYPTSGYPVAIPQNQRMRRVVALGGSTTGGAFQNDDLDEFYPALIGAQLGAEWDVLNQGVGGWTTWHMERYVDRKRDELKPDVLTLYVGHNDVLMSTPLPYRQLFAAWEAGHGKKQVGQTLQKMRSYNALRSFLVALRPAARRVAVPTDHAKENIVSIAQIFPNAKIVLGSEGLSPDPGPLASYNEMMKALAEEYSQITYVPIAERLHRYPAYQVYLDDCHLTAQGHEIVSEMFSEAIVALGFEQ